MTERGHELIVSIILALYITAAVAFECTAETARISTIGIYLVFLTGLIYLVLTRQFQINVHCLCLIMMLAYIYIMTMINNNFMSSTVAYYYLTCAALCVISYNLYICTYRERITKICLMAFILGALILGIRIVNSYGGFTAMFEYTSSGIHERRIGGDFLNENTFGTYMANAFFCCLVMFGKLKSQRPVFAIALLLISPFFIVMCLLSVSKKAILYIIFGFAILLLFLLRNYHGGRKIIALYISVLAIAVIYYLIMYIPAFRSVSLRFSSLFDHLSDSSLGSSSDRDRDKMISIGLSAFINSPIFGNGTAYSSTLFGVYAHNNFVELLMNYGIIGFSIYYFPYVILLPRLVSLTRSGDALALYFLIFVAMQIILGIAWVSYYERITQLFTIFAVAYSEKMTAGENEILHTSKYLK